MWTQHRKFENPSLHIHHKNVSYIGLFPIIDYTKIGIYNEKSKVEKISSNPQGNNNYTISAKQD